MTKHPDLDNIFQPDQIPSHTQVWGEAGRGKSVLVAPKLLDDASQTPSHLKINFHPKPSH